MPNLKICILIQEFCGIPLCLPCSMCIGIHGSAYVRVSVHAHLLAAHRLIIGKNNPKAEQIQTDNEYRMRWNRKVDRAIVSGMAETEIQQIKKEYISDHIRESVDVFGSQPERLWTILMSAVASNLRAGGALVILGKALNHVKHLPL